MNELKKEVSKYKNEANNIKLALDSMVKEVAEAKEAYQKELDAYKAQVAELRNSLKAVNGQKEAVVKAAKGEAEK